MLRVTLSALALAAGAVLAAAGEPDRKPDSPGGKKMLRAVVHISFGDQERQGHGLKNVRNILKEVGDDAAIEVVCHGAGLSLLVKAGTAHAEQVEKLLGQGVRFAACENTMREKSIGKDDLLPGVTTVPSGAVEVIRKQQEGYGYFKP